MRGRGNENMSVNTDSETRLTLLNSAPADKWIALSHDETRIVAEGNTFAEVAEAAERAGESDPVLIQVPENWTPGVSKLHGCGTTYKIVPRHNPHPALPAVTSVWMPMLSVRLSHKHGSPTKRFDALVDSGADECIFHADIGRAMGLNVEKGPKSSVRGIVPGQKIDIYYHHVNLWVNADMFG